MVTYSHSKISTFEQCKLKYDFKYIKKIKVEGGYGIEAFMGSLVHETLEKLYSDLKHGKSPTVEDLVTFFNRLWQEKYNEEEIVIVKEGMAAENYQGMGEKFVIHYYNRYKPFDQSMTLGLETQEFLDLDEKRKYHVRIDRLSKIGDSYEIHDYKTNSRLPGQKKIDNDRQLAMYSMWVRNRFKDAKEVKLIWHFLAFDTELTSERTQEQLEEMKSSVLVQIEEIESATEFPPTVTRLCDWCEYQEMCPAWSHKFQKEQKTLDEYEGKPGDELVDEYVKTKGELDKLSEKLDKLKDAIMRFAESQNVTSVFGKDKKANIKEVELKSWPRKHTEEREELVEILKELGLYDKASDLDPSALSKIIDKLDKEKAEKLKEFESIDKVKRVSFSNP